MHKIKKHRSHISGKRFLSSKLGRRTVDKLAEQAGRLEERICYKGVNQMIEANENEARPDRRLVIGRQLNEE